MSYCVCIGTYDNIAIVFDFTFRDYYKLSANNHNIRSCHKKKKSGISKYVHECIYKTRGLSDYIYCPTKYSISCYDNYNTDKFHDFVIDNDKFVSFSNLVLNACPYFDYIKKKG